MNRSSNLQGFAEPDLRDHIRVLVQRCEDIPTVPGAVAVILSLVEDVNASLDELEVAITRDVSCTARLLQMANSAFYGFKRTVTSVRRAILLLGFNSIKNIAISLPVFDGFLKHNTSEIASINGLWLHSVAVAALSRHIAYDLHVRNIHADLAFCAGLLHDLGRLVLLHLFPEDYSPLLARIEQPPAPPLVTAELQTFHVTHADVGRWLAEAWHFPVPILQAIAYHHHPRIADPLVMTVMLADHIVKTHHIGLTDGHSLVANPSRLARDLNLTPGHIDRYGAYIQTEADKLQRAVVNS